MGRGRPEGRRTVNIAIKNYQFLQIMQRLQIIAQKARMIDKSQMDTHSRLLKSPIRQRSSPVRSVSGAVSAEVNVHGCPEVSPYRRPGGVETNV